MMSAIQFLERCSRRTVNESGFRWLRAGICPTCQRAVPRLGQRQSMIGCEGCILLRQMYEKGRLTSGSYAIMETDQASYWTSCFKADPADPSLKVMPIKGATTPFLKASIVTPPTGQFLAVAFGKAIDPTIYVLNAAAKGERDVVILSGKVFGLVSPR